MGCFPSRGAKKLAPAAQPPPASWIFKARTGSQQMLAYDTARGDIRELPITGDCQFQQGMALCLWAAGMIFLVGGVEDGLATLKVDMSLSHASRVVSPPYPLAYGYMHRHGGKMYLVGALTHSKSAEMEAAAQPLTFNPALGKWEPLNPLPESVALCGSFFLRDCLYLLGGFVDFPQMPRPFQQVLQYSLKDSAWTLLPFTTSIENALPACIAVSDHTALIIGGFDPTDQLGESYSVYKFQSTGFEALESLPDLGQRRFTDSPCLSNGRVYLLSEDETLFIYNLSTLEWDAVDLVEKLGKSVPEERSTHPVRSSAAYVYHYLDSECAWLECCLEDFSTRKVEPSVFHSYLKHPGLMLLENGTLMLAGGLKQTRDIREAVDSVWTFDPATKQTWDMMNLPKRQYGLRLVCSEKEIYAIAGITESEAGGRCQHYNPSNKEWKSMPAMPYATQFPGVAFFRNCIYVLCGYAEVMEGAAALNLIQVYSPSTRQWDLRRTEYPQGVRYLCVCVLDATHLLCAGGVYASNDPCQTAYLFDDNSFEELESLPLEGSTKATSHFCDPVTYRGDSLYLCAQSGALYIFNTSSKGWSSQDYLISNRL